MLHVFDTSSCDAIAYLSPRTDLNLQNVSPLNQDYEMNLITAAIAIHEQRNVFTRVVNYLIKIKVMNGFVGNILSVFAVCKAGEES